MKFIYCEDNDIIDQLGLKYKLLLKTESGCYFINEPSVPLCEIEFDQSKICYTDSIVLDV